MGVGGGGGVVNVLYSSYVDLLSVCLRAPFYTTVYASVQTRRWQIKGLSFDL